MIKIRLAHQGDKKWVVPLMRDATRKGHFSSSVGGESELIFEQAVKRSFLITQQRRYGQTRRVFQFATMYVSEVNGIPAGVALCVTDLEGTEIHLAAVRTEFQHQGHFNSLVKYTIAHFNSHALLNKLPHALRNRAFFCAAISTRCSFTAPAFWNRRGEHSRLFVRCYPISQIAINSLKKNGFIQTPSNDGVIELTWLPA